MERMRSYPFPKPRRHTYYFLRHARQFSPVFLDTEVDMGLVKKDRARLLEEEGEKVSYIAFLIQVISNLLQKYPAANSAVQHSFQPKMALYERVNAKFTIDKVISGSRAVVSGLIPDSDQLSLVQIQQRINYFRDNSFEEIEEFEPIRKLQSLPLGIGQWVFNMAMGNLAKRGKLQGTFCVTSLGHRPIHSFYPIISATLCFGVGSIEDKPVVVDREITVRPMMRLSLAFDHRAIDGAMGADILADVKHALEHFTSEGNEVTVYGTTSEKGQV